MPSSHNPMLQRDMRAYETALASWVRQVKSQQHIVRAIAEATRKPNATGPFASVTRSVMAGNTATAQRQVSSHLLKMIEDSSQDQIDEHKSTLLRMLSGHFPELYKKVSLKGKK